jgi:hypothetical protein
MNNRIQPILKYPDLNLNWKAQCSTGGEQSTGSSPAPQHRQCSTRIGLRRASPAVKLNRRFFWANNIRWFDIAIRDANSRPTPYCVDCRTSN